MEFSKESIFHSSIRSFSHMFFGVFGFFIALIPVMIILFLVSPEGEKLDKNTVTFLQDLDGNNTVLPMSTPAILQINVHGVIGMEDQTEEVLRSILNESRKGILKNSRVKGVLLHVDSPGGGVNASDTMYSLLKEYKEKYNIPIYAFADGLCASGGYYISCAADKIYSTPSSIIGSVGVISGPFFNVTKTLEKIGVESLTVSQGKDKGMLSPFTPWKDGEDKSLKSITDYMYQRFTTIVTDARSNISKDQLVDEYGAHVFAGTMAQDKGYVDNGNLTYGQAMKKLLAAAKIDEQTPYQLVELKPKKNRIKDLFRGASCLFSGKIDHVLHIGAKEESLDDPLLYLYRP